jgi:hypothetical protein
MNFSHLNARDFLNLFQYAAVGVLWEGRKKSISPIQMTSHPFYNSQLEDLLKQCEGGHVVPSYESLMVPMITELAARYTTNSDIYGDVAQLLCKVKMAPQSIAEAAENIAVSHVDAYEQLPDNPLGGMFITVIVAD